MPSFNQIKELVGIDAATNLAKSTVDIQRHEDHWKDALEKYIDKMNEKVAHAITHERYFDELTEVDFEEIMVKHYLATIVLGFNIAREEGELRNKPKKKLLMSNIPPKAKVPKDMKKVFDLWDAYRKGTWKPARPVSIAKALKKEYLKKVKVVYEQASEDMRNGITADKYEVISSIRKATGSSYARANTIMQTETTSYYNKARKEVYDESEDVTHYLFMAIRDKRTTKWCTSYKKGGRDGLVYRKDDPNCKKDEPACHWNCRSEMVPLTPENPKHKRLIDSTSRKRENNNPYPLPKGWK